MKWILVKNNIVDNVIKADQDFIDLIKSKYDLCQEVENDFYVAPLFILKGEVYSAPPPIENPEEEH